MTETAGGRRGCSDPHYYEVRLQGHLDSRWADHLEGLALQRRNDGTTTLTGALPDQSALHGLLNRIRDLGVPIISIHRLCTEQEEKTND
ncbi:hypothetical protein AYO38_11515 [bacterium SCGC AG-212-C10]|nr:hypothetical protein AYO38_11515 [bacterium SCGC AG-212-C10]